MGNELIIKQNKKLIPKENISILSAIKSIDIESLDEDEIKALSFAVARDVNINKMRECVQYACTNLSQVGPVKMGADLSFIAKDNQERLELVFKLLDTFGRFEFIVNNIRRNKFDCRDNFDLVYRLLTTTEELADAVIDHSDFKIKELEENNRYVEELLRKRHEKELEESNRKLLKGGDE